MVFFTCNACGQAVKKNQVEKHYSTKCRNCTVLSCIDCGKEFVGEEYQTHVKCITEDEKYGGKGFQPKPSSAKGETKQANWIANIKKYVAEADVPNNLANLLNTLVNYNNVPRKKQKFQNFLNNSVHVRDRKLADEAWEIFEKANKTEVPTKGDENEEVAPPESKGNESDQKADETVPPADTAVKKHKKKKKNKDKEMNESNGNVQNGCEIEGKMKENGKDELEVTDSTEKHENREAEEVEAEINNTTEDVLSNGDVSKKSKKKKKHDMELTSECQEDVTVNKQKKKKKKREREDEMVDEPDMAGDADKVKKKKKREKMEEECTNLCENADEESNTKRKHKKRKSKDLDEHVSANMHEQPSVDATNPAEIESELTIEPSETDSVPKQKKKKKKHTS